MLATSPISTSHTCGEPASPQIRDCEGRHLPQESQYSGVGTNETTASQQHPPKAGRSKSKTKRKRKMREVRDFHRQNTNRLDETKGYMGK
jgi:hypothetical protein